MKSNSISTTSVPKGMGDVPRPRAVTYSGTCQLWLTQGVRDNLTLPTIWVHRCRVAAVSRQLKYGRSGHTAGSARIALLRGNQGLIREHTRSAHQSEPALVASDIPAMTQMGRDGIERCSQLVERTGV